MLADRIKELTKLKQVVLFCDMDGVLVEYNIDQKSDIVNNVPKTYFNNRPLTHTINNLKLLGQMPNVTVAILSNCYHKEQRNEKIEWLKIHAPFISQENVHIIVYAEQKFEKSSKDFLKARKISEIIYGKDVVPILIEDNHEIIKATNSILPNTAYHVSEIIG